MRIVWILVLFLGCAVPEGSEEAGEDATTSPPRPLDRGLPPVQDLYLSLRDLPQVAPDAAPASCVSGQRLALCVLCSSDGQPEIARDDAECPPIHCGDQDSYRLEVLDGVESCYRMSRGAQPGIGRCLDVARCRMADDPNYCTELPPQLALENREPCQTITGCVNGAPGVLEPAPAGTPCPDGICQGDGRCDTEIFSQCEDFDEFPICGRGVNSFSTRRFCSIENSSGENCQRFCYDLMASCEGGALSDGECIAGEGAGCIREAPLLICDCGIL